MAGAQTNIRTFIAPLKGPGRTAPSFAEDLTLYDPIHPPSTTINLLRDPPVTEAGLVHELALVLPANSCKHQFCTKDKQSDLPALDERPDEKTIWKLSVICRRCRLHAELRVDYTLRWDAKPCPNQESPLHHFLHSSWREDLARNQWKTQNAGNQDEIYTFECSSRTCSATVFIRLSLPIFGPDALRVLTDEALLKQRTTDAFQRWPSILEGVGRPSVFDVVFDLRKYIRNAWDSTVDGRRIGLDNRRFVVRFGPEGLPCREVLEEAGFIFKPGEGWEPPRADFKDLPPFTSSQNILLDNVEHELSVIISQLSQTERRAAQDTTMWRDAMKDIARILSCQNYDKDPRSRSMAPTRAPCYVGLGIDPTASDANVIFAYRKQVETDSSRTAFYLTWLNQVSVVRQSEEIQLEIVLQRSKGRFMLEQIHDAYRYFGFPTQDADDEHIIGTYKSRLSDAPRQGLEMREHLRIIGEYRRNTRIIEIAKGTLETYEQALTFFNADNSTPDDYIHSLYTAKVAEDFSTEPQARKAVDLIARKRNSKVLLEFVKTGRMGDVPMDLAEAYRMFGIDDRTTGDDLLVTCYNLAVEDNPGNIEQINRAIKAIADDRKTDMLQKLAGGKASADTPVGLQNIGNTCYLNSLLQYFFTVTILKRIVLDFDKYKQKLDNAEIRSKKVGRLAVKPQQVETAQKFVLNLASLFQEMITSPDPAIKPKQELARLTLESKGAVDKVRRRSTIASGGRPSLGHIDSMPVYGPIGPPNNNNSTATTTEEAIQTESPVDLKPADPFADPIPELANGQKAASDDKAHSSDDAEMIDVGDNSSDATLVSNVSMADSNGGASAVRDEQQKITDNKENLLPSTAGEGVRRSASPDKHLHPLTEASGSDINSQAGALVPPAQVLSDAPAKPAAEIPKKPPPIPPRPQAKEQQQDAEKTVIETYAQQQDVTEVIGHCLYQFSLAIRPLGYDQDGEQLDEIHNLFYGKQVTKIIPEDASRNTYELFSNILTRVGSNPTDIYGALDGYFDVEDVDGAKRYISIVDLPPILAIQLDRVEYDTQSHRAKKNNGHVELRETIYLDRYLDTPVDSALMERRQQTWAMKKDLARMSSRMEDLAANEEPNAAEVLHEAQLSLLAMQEHYPLDEGEEPLGVSDKMISTVGALAAQAAKEIEVTTQATFTLNQNINSNFTDMRKHGYRLHAAFFHRGTAGFGHYWIYIYDKKNELWRKYNDDYVSVVTNTGEIFDRPAEAEPTYKGSGMPANPYFLVYVRDDPEIQLVEAVHRKIVEHPAPPPATNQMSEMPPNIEMVDHDTSEQSRPYTDPTIPNYQALFPIHEKTGDWDNRENAYQPSSGQW